MTTYWIVETKSKTLTAKVEAEEGRDQEVTSSKGASNEQCMLRVPDDTDADYVQVDGTAANGELGLQASDLSLSEDTASKYADAWAAIRATRDTKLTDTDWTQITDAPLTPTQVTNWATYRQELRDVPENTPDPNSFDTENDWPIEPQV